MVPELAIIHGAKINVHLLVSESGVGGLGDWEMGHPDVGCGEPIKRCFSMGAWLKRHSATLAFRSSQLEILKDDTPRILRLASSQLS